MTVTFHVVLYRWLMLVNVGYVKTPHFGIAEDFPQRAEDP